MSCLFNRVISVDLVQFVAIDVREMVSRCVVVRGRKVPAEGQSNDVMRRLSGMDQWEGV